MLKNTTKILPLLLLIGLFTAGDAGATDWDAVAACESGGNWHIRGGSYSGGLQFTSGTWHSNGGNGEAWQASREEQIRVAENVMKTQGPRAWPVCSRRG